eukprot:SAG11_NODE_36041_length_263_cov_1.579268_1_plen_49_part_01
MSITCCSNVKPIHLSNYLRLPKTCLAGKAMSLNRRIGTAPGDPGVSYIR